MPKLKVTVGTLKLSAKAKRYVNDALNKNRLSYGPYSKDFEKLFASMHDVGHAVVSNSGTSALHIALAALKELYKWKDYDEVLVPATTFVATANVVLYNNLKPVFVDVDPLYYEIDPNKIEEKITRRTKAIIPVHLFGQPADMRPIIQIAKKYNLKIIEDSAETMLARYKGKSVGSLGDIGCFSTYVAHLLTTGVGGINTTKDPEIAILLRSLLNHGRHPSYLSIDGDGDGLNEQKFKNVIKNRFSFLRFGHSFRTTEMESAIGLAHLEDELEPNIIKRRKNAKLLTTMMRGLGEFLQLPSIRAGNDHSFMMYPVVLKGNKISRMELIYFLEKRGIETRDMLPLINQPVYKKLFHFKKSDYPISQWLIDSGFYIGCHQNISFKDLEYVVSQFYSFFKKKL